MRIDSGFQTIQIQQKAKEFKSKSFSIEMRNIQFDELFERLINTAREYWREKNGGI